MNDITERTFDFALRIIKLSQFLNKKYKIEENVLSKQILRSGTSIGANVEEAQAGQSRADFISKMAIALKEARETNYWLRLIEKSGMVKADKIAEIKKNPKKLRKLLAQS
jgi:four helix bundle protein